MPPARSSRVLALVGPTASGKTALSIPLARALRGEIISMDSRQVYRGMDVGTDKVEPAERAEICHHGLDLVDPDERYSAGRFAREARRWIGEIEARGRTPLLVGGTGFFLRSLLAPVFREPSMDPVRRERLRRHLAACSREHLEAWVRKLDPERMELAAAGGPQRLARAVEVALLTGRPLSWWHRNAPPEADPIDALIVLLRIPREELYRRIDRRVDRMMERGLEEEVQALLAAGHEPEDPGMSGTGYREVAAWLRGDLSREEAVERTRRATRRYARRQLTWFRHQLPRGVLELDGLAPVDQNVERILEGWARSRGRVGGRGDHESAPDEGVSSRQEGDA